MAELRWFAPDALPAAEELAFACVRTALAAWRRVGYPAESGETITSRRMLQHLAASVFLLGVRRSVEPHERAGRDLDVQRLPVRPAGTVIVCERLSTRSSSWPAARVRTRSCSTPSMTVGAPTTSTARRRTITLIFAGRCRRPSP